MHHLWILLFLIAQIFTLVYCQSQYSVIAPGTIRSNRKYSVAVNLHDAPAPATIRVSISSITRSLNLSQEVTLQPHTTQLIDFMPPNLLNEPYYMLKAEGVSGIILDKGAPLTAIKYGGPTVFIESDRAIYKPGDIVQFRVIILDEHTKPVNIAEPIRVQILDAGKNRVKQFKDIRLKRGVFVGRVPLSRQPILGNWTIGVYISGKYNQHEEKQFKVEKYVLPKFSVHVETVPIFSRREHFLKATVYGKYTFGEYVEGTAIVKLLTPGNRGYKDAPFQIATIGNGTVKAEVVLDTRASAGPTQFIVYATLIEKLTNVTATGEALVDVKYNLYNYIMPESDVEFRDNQPYRMKVHVEHWNGTRVRGISKEISLRFGNKSYKSYVNDEGIAQFEFEYDPLGHFMFYSDGDFFSYDNIFSPILKYEASDGVGVCKIQMKEISFEHQPKSLEINVSYTSAIPYFFYTITSHGNIVRDEYVRVPDNQKSHTIMLNVSAEMIPQCYMYVHYIIERQLYCCEFTIRLAEKFKNEISISAPTKVKPGQQITMDVNAQPNSHVSIVAVDKSSLLLSSDNLLSMDDILRNLKFDRAYVEPISDGYRAGSMSGLITLTDAMFFELSVFLPIPLPPLDNSNQPRSIFPETWIFEDMEIDKAVTPLTVKVPDTITTWIVRAFSVNDHDGFGMMESTVDILAFQPFFIGINLPYSVRLGEVVTIPVTIFNYLQQSYRTEVIMDNSKTEFQFVDNKNRTTDFRIVDVPANNGMTVAFIIIPNKLGDIDILITAKNSNSTDAILQKLKVEPQGIKQQHNSDVSITLNRGQCRETTFQADIPATVVTGSEYLTLSVSGDVLVSALENLNDLVMKPSGCGEQNMINLVPNILILEYLKITGMYSNQTLLVDKAKRFIEMGYQQELTYRHQEGGYSVFGPDSSGVVSNWLTAYVARFFIKGKKYSSIETRIITSDLEYLAKQQNADGSFPERGYLFEPAHQNQYGFTAFVLLAFLEDDKYAQKYHKTIENAMNFLTTNLNSINDTYSLAIMVNVYQKLGNTHTDDIISKIKSKAHQDNGLMWWTNDETITKSTNDVEITAYILMALLETPGQYVAIFNWLIKQRNSHGGYESTQDTVVALQALIKYTEKSTLGGLEDTHVKVHYVAKDAAAQKVKEHVLGIEPGNELLLQTQELPATTRSLNVQVMGRGRVFLQFAYHYYVSTDNSQTRETQQSTTIIPTLDPRISLPLTEQHQYFILKATAKLPPTSKTMIMAICYLYQPLKLDDTSTNMVILQVQFPSGFVANSENIETLREEDEIGKVDVDGPSTKLEIYFEKLQANDEQCLTVMADRLHMVQSLQSSVIAMFDYYNSERRSEIFYDVLM